MDYADIILTLASEIYELYEAVKDNKETCQRVLVEVKSLERQVKSIKKRDTVRALEDVERTLSEVVDILKAGRELIRKCTMDNWFKRVVKAYKRKESLRILIERICSGLQRLQISMNLEQLNAIHTVHEEMSRKEDDEAARKDDKALKELMEKTLREQPEKLEEIKSDVQKLLEKLSSPKDNSDGIRMITQDELENEGELLMKTATSEVYKGKYRRFQVAIKRYMEPVNRSPSKIRAFFEREVVTMKQFESPNILRMYGICVRDNGPNPQFLIVTEYCERGSLRQVLDSNLDLSWLEKAQMCLDAAQGLYRLHNTEVRSRVHGSITSSKFLVAKDLSVKLGGFELAKTETSLRRSKIEDSRSSYYESPQKLDDINYEYTKECEIYSFGIVLWEIATREIPFKDMSVEEIQNQVCVERPKVSIPDCPERLEQLINDCRVFDAFLRPSAGVLVDRLQIIVAQLEKQ